MIKKIIEFLFFRWKCEVLERGDEKWSRITRSMGVILEGSQQFYYRSYIDYKYTNKFDGSIKIKRVYLN